MYYELADIMVDELFTRYVKVFNKTKTSLIKSDEINVLPKINETYLTLQTMTMNALLELAQRVYEEFQLKDYSNITPTNQWLAELLADYDETTKYVFTNELERKKERCYESVMSVMAGINGATNNSQRTAQINEQIDIAMRYYCRQISQAAITVTDAAVKKAYTDSGVTRLKWQTEEDERVCTICAERNGKIYPVNRVPSKPHIGCRCEFIRIEGKDEA